MKKIIFLAVLPLLAVACVKDELDYIDMEYEMPEYLVGTFEDGDTRVQMNTQDKTVWNKKDNISVFYRNDRNNCWTFGGETGDVSGKFYINMDITAELPSDSVVPGQEEPAANAYDHVVVLYPYDGNATLNPEENVLTATLPSTQAYCENSFPREANLMCSYGTTNEFVIRNLSGLLQLQLTGTKTVSRIVFYGNNDELLAGEVNVDVKNMAVAPVAGKAVKSLVLDCGDAGVQLNEENPTSFYIAIPPQNFSVGFTIEANFSDGTVLKKSSSNPLRIKRNVITPMASLSDAGSSDYVSLGKYGAPYLRYEAEPDVANGKCTFLPQSDNKRDIQNEASHQIAAQLVNEGDYLEWTCLQAADGMVIRFSLPDGSQGGGTKGHVSLLVDGEVVCESIELDSYHAWQYKDTGAGAYNWYYDNTPRANGDVRMKYDEKRVLLDEKIPVGATFRLVKLDGGSTPYTIDFVELEPVPAPISPEESGAVYCFNPETDGELGNYVHTHAGSSIYLPPGHYDFTWHWELRASNTKLLGAGPWYTELHYTADPTDLNTINRRGIIVKDSPDNFEIRNLYLDTDLERRYLNYHGSTGANGTPPGKGVNGDFGDNLVLDNLWIEHFECGVWITSLGDNASITRCRIRNNYADGLHSTQGRNLEISHCYCRNNGDDQLVTNFRSEYSDDLNTEIHHCVVDLGWRAGGLASLGGSNLNVHDIWVEDHFENGFRMVNEFAGYEYRDNLRYSNITLMRCGSRGDTDRPAEYGGMTGGESAALQYSCAGKTYQIQGVELSDIDIVSPRSTGIGIGSPKQVQTEWNNIRISNWGTPVSPKAPCYGVKFEDGATGTIRYSNLILTGNESTKISPVPSSITFSRVL